MRVLRVFFCLALLCSAQANDLNQEINPKKTLAGFKFSQKYISLDGRQDIWSVKLFPNGRLTWEGNHLGNNGACSKKAGHLVRNIDTKKHSSLVLMAYDVVTEQKKLTDKTQSKVPKRKTSGGMSLGVELGDKYIISEVKDPHTKKMISFKKRLVEVADEMVKIENSRPWALELDVDHDKSNIRATFKNIGKLDTRLITSKDANDSFYFQKNLKKVHLEYADHKFSNIDKVIHPGKSFTVVLKKDHHFPKGKGKLVFQNQFNRSIKNKIVPLNITLCDEVK